MTKLLYATGDSFVLGQELGTAKFGIVETPEMLFTFNEYKRKHSYTGLLCDRWSIPNYKNSACPGGSNERAYRFLINDVSEALQSLKPEEIFVMIGLTHDNRREFCMNNEPDPRQIGGDYYIHLSAWEPPKLPQIHNHELWTVLTRYFDHDRGHFMFGMMMLLGMQNFLQVNKIPYLITSSMGNYYEVAAQKKFIPQHLLDQINTVRCMRDPSFMEYVKDQGFAMGPQLHPLEEGHISWANYLQDYVEQNNLIKNDDL